ncbi:anthocyanin 3'-O-beta-glucosyltransferase, partial [Trifolium pratense]
VLNDSSRRSYGAVFNSFHSLEGAYEEHYKNAFGTKCWSLGPVSSWVNQDVSDKAERGHKKVEEEDEDGDLFKWLNSKKENSVIYVCFGSVNKFSTSQLIEIAHALEASSHDFIWVVRKNNDKEGEDEGFMEEFEKRVKESNKGYLIWGWAPQLLILENKAIGAIVTHCGWSTATESINIGLPMVTWPLFADQFFNEKMLVDVLKIGVSVGAKEWRNYDEFGSEVVKRNEIEKAIRLVMENGKEAEEMRLRAKSLSDDAKKAILVGGSSHANLTLLIEELKSLKLQKLNANKPK